MCFSAGDEPTVYRESWHVARKEYRCCECRLPIRPGERYQRAFGVWEGEAQTFHTCEVCAWLRERVTDEELEHGCGDESTPGFGYLNEAFDEAEYWREAGWRKRYGMIELEVT